MLDLLDNGEKKEMGGKGEEGSNKDHGPEGEKPKSYSRYGNPEGGEKGKGGPPKCEDDSVPKCGGDTEPEKDADGKPKPCPDDKPLECADGKAPVMPEGENGEECSKEGMTPDEKEECMKKMKEGGKEGGNMKGKKQF